MAVIGLKPVIGVSLSCFDSEFRGSHKTQVGAIRFWKGLTFQTAVIMHIEVAAQANTGLDTHPGFARGATPHPTGLRPATLPTATRGEGLGRNDLPALRLTNSSLALTREFEQGHALRYCHRVPVFLGNKQA
jgi:hypothetical protein